VRPVQRQVSRHAYDSATQSGRNPYLVDLGTVEGVVDALPRQRPEHRPDIDLRYITLGPADVDIGFSGRHGPGDPLHQRIAKLSPGDQVSVSGRLVKTSEGRPVGRLASKTDLETVGPVTGSVSGILVRTREHTPSEYRPGLKADSWETVLVEVALPRS
jgi:ATP-dependent DNA helicase RecQ